MKTKISVRLFGFAVTFILGSPIALAEVCLRFAGAPLSVLPSAECTTALETFERSVRTPQLMKDYETFLFEQERNPQLAWRNFAQKALAKNWAAEDQSLMIEVVDWSARQSWKVDPQLERQIEQLKNRQDLQITPDPQRTRWVEKLAQLPGWEDLKIITPVSIQNGKTEDEESVIAKSSVRRWVVYSSVYQPIVHWGEARDLERIMKASAKAWVEGDCRNSKLGFLPGHQADTARIEAVRAWDANTCVTQNMLSVGKNQTATANPTQPEWPLSGKAPEAEVKSRKHHWLWISLLVGAAAAYGLRDKTLVITR